jgi:hypothetical protein
MLILDLPVRPFKYHTQPDGNQDYGNKPAPETALNNIEILKQKKCTNKQNYYAYKHTQKIKYFMARAN